MRRLSDVAKLMNREGRERLDVYSLPKYKFPPLFELLLPLDFKKKFDEYVALVNALVLGQKTTIKCYFLLFPVSFAGTIVDQVTELDIAERDLRGAQLVTLEDQIRCGLLLMVILKNNNKSAEAEAMRNQLLERISSIEPQLRSPEFYWYQAYLLLERQNLGNVALLDLLTCAKQLTVSQTHKHFLYNRILELSEDASGYISDDVVAQFIQVFSGRMNWLDDECYLGVFAQVRHKFVNRRFRNIEFFDYQKQLSSMKQANQDEIYSITMPAKPVRVVNFSEHDLYKFVSYVRVPSLPILKLIIPGKTEQELGAFNQLILKRMRVAGFCNSQGYTIAERLFPEKQIERIKTEQEFHEIIIYCLQACFPEFAQLTEANILEHVRKNFPRLNELQQGDKNIRELEHLAGGLNSLVALALFTRCVMDVDSREDKIAIMEIVTRCFNIAAMAEEYNRTGNLRGKHDGWFDIARDVVDNHLNKGEDALLAVGTPIKRDEKSYSTHAFYLVIKQLPKKHNNHCVQIMIINGGRYVDGHHIKVNFMSKNETDKYKVAASQPIVLTEDTRLVLKHYIYRAISLEYSTVIAEVEETNPAALKNLLQSIYLQQSTFLGYGGQSLLNFIRTDIEVYFSAQIRGNCTIHNLKYALKVMLGLDELQYGAMLDGVVIGLDKLISTLPERRQEGTRHSTQQQTTMQTPPSTIFAGQEASATSTSTSTNTIQRAAAARIESTLLFSTSSQGAASSKARSITVPKKHHAKKKKKKHKNH